jgi:hypothetical protein
MLLWGCCDRCTASIPAWKVTSNSNLVYRAGGGGGVSVTEVFRAAACTC